MPIHDWTQVRAGIFHNFHFLWTATIANQLNAGLLPPGFFAMAEQIVSGPEPDVVALHAPGAADAGGVALATERPRARYVMAAEHESERYARKARRIAVHHELGHVVAVIEIVSPGNKESKHALRSFVEKAILLIQQEVNLLIVDLFPPGPRDPQGIHKEIWEEFSNETFQLPEDKQLTLAAYQISPSRIAYVEPVAVGDTLPNMPLFLQDDYFASVPLEETYQSTWNALPIEVRGLLAPAKRA
jgi:hypothetical protein